MLKHQKYLSKKSGQAQVKPNPAKSNLIAPNRAKSNVFQEKKDCLFL